MSVPNRWTRALALGAVLLCAPAPARAQRIAIAPSAGSGEPAASAASVDALLDQTTAVLMEQVRVLTEPGRDLGDETISQPCDRQLQPPQMGVARMRPDAVLSAAFWRIRANQTIARLQQPLSVCFPSNRDLPDRAYLNVIRFNSEWLARRGGGRTFVLAGYAQRGESSATLGRDRAISVRQGSDANLHPRLIPVDAGCSDVPGVARWVHYVLTPRPGPAPRPTPCP